MTLIDADTLIKDLSYLYTKNHIPVDMRAKEILTTIMEQSTTFDVDKVHCLYDNADDVDIFMQQAFSDKMDHVPPLNPVSHSHCRNPLGGGESEISGALRKRNHGIQTGGYPSGSINKRYDGSIERKTSDDHG